MIRSLSTAKTGLEAQQTNLDVITNNLANVSTNGFKGARAVFADLLYQNLRQPGAQNNVQDRLPTGLQVGTGVRPVAVVRLMTQGSPELTNNPYDIAINGEGFFRIVMPDGTINYTRDGSFQPNANGDLVTVEGGLLLDPVINVAGMDPDTLVISPQGDVEAVPTAGGPPVPLGPIEITTFINPAGLQSMGRNLYQETAASGPPNDNIPENNGAGSLLHKYVESSNVSVVEEMVEMIQTQRAYEVNSRAVQTSDEMLARLTQM